MRDAAPHFSSGWAELLDWRRQMVHLYAQVRALYREDPREAQRIWRAGRDRLFGQHPQSPLTPEARDSFAGLPYWSYDPAFVFEAEIEPRPEVRLIVPSSTGQEMPLVRFGAVELPGFTLDVYWIDVYGGGLFIPFRDATAGTESYGGGRYLLDTVKGADLGADAGGRLLFDFNFAYHPSCFYNSRWSCPLAPPANVTALAVRAGERAQ